MITSHHTHKGPGRTTDRGPRPTHAPRHDTTAAPIRVVDAAELLGLKLPPREPMLGRWLTRQSLNMVYAWRGVGKTHFALGVAYAVASGGPFLGWSTSRPWKVLYLDGEMPGPALQDRLAAIAGGAETEPPPGYLRFITPDLQEAGMPDLSTYSGQEKIAESVAEADLIVVDNLSTLVRSGKENESESWNVVAEWALQLRARGKSVLFIHHAGKGGQQRGTSKREDILDVVIALKHPADYDPATGAKFEVHFEKARGLYGDDVQPIEAHLASGSDGTQVWTCRAVEDSEITRVAELVKEGATQSDVADELGLSRFQTKRRIDAAIQKGLISPGAVRDGRREKRTPATPKGNSKTRLRLVKEDGDDDA